LSPVTSFGTSVSLDAETPVLFLSDLHFGDGTGTDLFANQDGDLISLLDRWRDRVGAIVLLGDILDMPQAWRVPRIRAAHGDLLSYLSQLAAETRLVFVRGNHDWSVNYESLFPGATCCEAVLLGHGILAWHGHQVDLLMNPGAGNARLKTYAHALLERLAGCRLVPPLERYDSPANRVAMATATLWARMTMTGAGVLRTVGRTKNAAALEERVRYLARSFIGDPADLFGRTQRTVLGAGFNTVVCGHSHFPGIARTARGLYINTGSWTCGSRTAAHWTGKTFRALDLHTGRELGDELFIGLPEETEPQDLFRWWKQHHRGFLRFEL
jgi:UDP-2,3-diacylglucosamine pyrophosphatase LpxH